MSVWNDIKDWGRRTREERAYFAGFNAALEELRKVLGE